MITDKRLKEYAQSVLDDLETVDQNAGIYPTTQQKLNIMITALLNARYNMECNND